MPTIFDNINTKLLTSLAATLKASFRADFCVGYFNLRGWRPLSPLVEPWDGSEAARCRVLVGMQRGPQEALREMFGSAFPESYDSIDNATATKLLQSSADDFRKQLVVGIPSDTDEATLRSLADQLSTGKLQVKLYLRHSLHAKLYLCFREDHNAPIVGFLGSSNLTFSGLSNQGELNIDVLDQDACNKLAGWFMDRWDDRFAVDISSELVDIINNSWARPDMLRPFVIYAKMAYHLSREARAGLSEFKLAPDIANVLLDHQAAAVKIGAKYLLHRGGVIIGDVVGLGKTLTAVALARILQDEHRTEALIICPKNLVNMWETHVHKYRLLARVVPISQVIRDLPQLRRFRLVIIDESHNLRNREGRRYRAIHEYIKENESRCLLLSATPYNKSLLDLSNQLRLFMADDQEIGIRPERMIREIGDIELARQIQGSPRTLAAFERSTFVDDWRSLMALVMVRRTRSFIEGEYGTYDPEQDQIYLTFSNGSRFYFPKREVKTLKFAVNPRSSRDTYAKLQSPKVVNLITGLRLPRYGLGNYIKKGGDSGAKPTEARILKGLSRAGKRLIGFCRTGFFKRLESSGDSFIRSVYRHLLRNQLHVHAIENELPLPIGLQSFSDASYIGGAADVESDVDLEILSLLSNDNPDDEGEATEDDPLAGGVVSDGTSLKAIAAKLYSSIAASSKRSIQWIHPKHFTAQLLADLKSDINELKQLLDDIGPWEPARDAKLNMLYNLLAQTHANEKVLVFTQYADTARYLERELRTRGLTDIAAVTGESDDPMDLAVRFSPASNDRTAGSVKQLRILIATDILSEGQNLQDAAIVVNYDLPWAIIRLSQRAGRIDRIGQRARVVKCYTFMPSEGVESVIRLRRRLRQRLHENAEVVGTDESFFEEDEARVLIDLYNENAKALDEVENNDDVDLASQALQAWRRALRREPSLETVIPGLPNVVYSTRSRTDADNAEGVIVYTRTSEGIDSLSLVGKGDEILSESPSELLRLAECEPDAAAIPRPPNYHERVAVAVRDAAKDGRMRAGTLGRPSAARFRVYERLSRYNETLRHSLFASHDLEMALQEVLRLPLQQSTTDTLNRMLRAGASDVELSEVVVSLHNENKLCVLVEDTEGTATVDLICSLGIGVGD